MFELNDEETLMYSDDRSIKLTTHRILYQKDNKSEQLMLEDFESYEIKTAHIGNYKMLTIVFSCLILLLIAYRANEYFAYKSILSYSDLNFVQYILLFPGNFLVILLCLSILFLLISRRNLLRINGKFNSIEFRVYNPRGKSFQRFLQTLVVQSGKIKNKP